MAGHKQAGLGVIAVRQRNTRVIGHTARGGDAGHDLKRHAGLGQLLQLFTTTPKNEGVAPFEAHHLLAFLREFDQQRIDLFLPQGVLVAALASVNALSIGGQKSQHAIGYQVVINNDIGFRHDANGAQGEQLWIARACANEINAALAYKGCGVERRRNGHITQN